MEIIIRPATVADCAVMMELINELAEYEKAPQEVTVDFNHFVESGFGKNPIWYAYVAEVMLEGNLKVVGMALYYIRYSTWKGQRLYLEDLVVSQNYRGNGIGNLLFEKLIAVTKEKKYSGMMWQVLDWNEPAINFYNKYNTQFDAGWTNCFINM